MILWEWDGEAARPLPRFRKACDRELVVGQVYVMDPVQERSWRSHRHYFATIHSAWSNLHERFANEPWAQSAEALRKHALIMTGWRRETVMECESESEAARWAARVAAFADYSIVVPRGAQVVILTARSQSAREMGKEDFAKSKEAVLEWLADLLRSGRADLEAAGDEEQ